MFCDNCGRYVKKGHGIRIYTYRGVYNYYCLLCNSVRNWSIRNSNRRSTWFNLGFLVSLFIGFLVYYFYPKQWLKTSENTSYLKPAPWYVIFIPPIVWLILYFLLVLPYLKGVEKENFKPLAKKQKENLEMINYLLNIKKKENNSFCQCRRCLIEEYNKGNKSEDSKEKTKKLFDWG